MKARKLNLNNKTFIVVAASIVIVLGAYLLVRAINNTGTDDSSGNPTTSENTPRTGSTEDEGSEETQKSGSAGGTTSGNNNPQSGSEPNQPYGDFVNNHKPNLDGNPVSNNMSSACNTSVGATCKILFTKGNMIKELTAKKTDASGSVFWSWKLQDIGLSAGSWQIEAQATLNGKTSTTSDPLVMEIGQ